MHYAIEMPSNPFVLKILQDTLEWLKSQDDMRADLEKLANVCCAVDAPVTIARAPTPKTFAEANINLEKRVELETYLL